MTLPAEQVLLRVYLQSADRAPRAPTSGRIVRAALDAKLAGATVLRGIMGTGYHGIAKPSIWSLVEHVPVIVEIVDSQEQILQFLRGPFEQIMVGGMATLERAAVIMNRKPHGPAGGGIVPTLAREVQPLSTLPHLDPGSHMKVNENGGLLRVFIGESDHYDGVPLYQAIVKKVRELGLAGATVLRGSEGFGARSVVHTSALLGMSTDLPIIIEIVDTTENIELIRPHLQNMVREGMITMEYVVILMYHHGDRK